MQSLQSRQQIFLFAEQRHTAANLSPELFGLQVVVQVSESGTAGRCNLCAGKAAGSLNQSGQKWKSGSSFYFAKISCEGRKASCPHRHSALEGQTVLAVFLVIHQNLQVSSGWTRKSRPPPLSFCTALAFQYFRLRTLFSFFACVLIYDQGSQIQQHLNIKFSSSSLVGCGLGKSTLYANLTINTISHSRNTESNGLLW